MDISAMRTVPGHNLITQKAVNTNQMGKMEAKSKEFEEVFMNEMLGQMFSQVDVDPEFGGGFSEKIYRGLLVNEYSKTMTETNKTGVSDLVLKEMIKMQGGR